MSGKKHVFEIVPGKVFDTMYSVDLELERRQYGDRSKVPRIEFKPLSSTDTIEPVLQVKMCTMFNPKGLDCLVEEKNNLVRIERYHGDSNYSSFLYYGDQLMQTSFYVNRISLHPVEYQYLTWKELDDGTHECYFSDQQGNMIDSKYRDVLKKTLSSKGQIKINDMISSNKDLILSDTFARTFIEELTENQIKTFTNVLIGKQMQKIIPELNSNQLQILVKSLTDDQIKRIAPDLSLNKLKTLTKNLTDKQFEDLVDHLTYHQLQILTHKLNPGKLLIVASLLDNNQLSKLVENLDLEQVKQIFPHLKMDQFREAINTISNDQLVELAKNLDEHHLTILSKELWYGRLSTLVNTLEADGLSNLVNKLDHEKLAIVAQNLTDPNRIKMIIESLADNPEKLQSFARNMPNEQFKELLNNVGAEKLKEIIHKLPHEKVKAVVDDFCKPDNNAVKGLKETLKELMDKINNMLPEQAETDWGNAHLSTDVFQDVNAEFAVTDHLL